MCRIKLPYKRGSFDWNRNRMGPLFNKQTNSSGLQHSRIICTVDCKRRLQVFARALIHPYDSDVLAVHRNRSSVLVSQPPAELDWTWAGNSALVNRHFYWDRHSCNAIHFALMSIKLHRRLKPLWNGDNEWFTIYRSLKCMNVDSVDPVFPL